MTPADLHTRTATQVAAAIRAREVTATQVLEALLVRIARHNHKLNAIVTLDEAGARQRAREADAALDRGEVWGPLHGVPVTIKDVFEVAGMRSTASHKPLARNVPAEDATAVARLRAAGAVIVGKTNLPELAMDFQTDSPIFGRSNNPWDLGRTPGGSTGGGAAAVSAGLSYLELGSDLAGSLRVPAHFCGIYSLAPTEGLVPRAGHLPRRQPGGALGRLLRVGPLARSIDDLRLCLSVIAGPDPGEPDLPPVALTEPPARALADLRIAWTDDVGGVPIDADTKGLLWSCVDILAQLGCQVDRRSPADYGFDFELARRLHSLTVFTSVGLTLPAALRLAGRYVGRMEAFDLSLRRYAEAETQRVELIAIMERLLSEWDVWICPVTATPAFPHHKPRWRFGPTPIYDEPIPFDDLTIDYGIANSSFTTPINVTGHPVVVMPIGRSAAGLPVGAQVVGRRWDDLGLLAIVERLVEAAGPLRWPPGFGAGEAVEAEPPKPKPKPKLIRSMRKLPFIDAGPRPIFKKRGREDAPGEAPEDKAAPEDEDAPPLSD
jgi:amidase